MMRLIAAFIFCFVSEAKPKLDQLYVFQPTDTEGKPTQPTKLVVALTLSGVGTKESPKAILHHRRYFKIYIENGAETIHEFQITTDDTGQYVVNHINRSDVQIANIGESVRGRFYRGFVGMRRSSVRADLTGMEEWLESRCQKKKSLRCQTETEPENSYNNKNMPVIALELSLAEILGFNRTMAEDLKVWGEEYE